MSARGRWNKLKEAVYSPYLKHQKLGMDIPSGLNKDDWLKYPLLQLISFYNYRNIIFLEYT